MTRTFLTALRRASRLMRPAKLTKATRSVRNAMAGFMVKSALAPLAVVVTSRKLVWSFLEQLGLQFVPVLHRLQG